MKRISSIAIVLCLLAYAPLEAQEVPIKLTLESAIELASKNYPAIHAARAKAAAAKAGVDLARTAYLPRTDLIWQENRATRNNVFGLLLPQSGLPSISGPVLGTTSYSSAWGSAGGLLVSWEPFDFGLRKANMDLARALRDGAGAGVDASLLDVETGAADAFLVLVEAGKTVAAAQADVDRLTVFARSVHTLVDNQLRPGADGSRADAELAAARNQLIRAREAAEISRVNLAEALGSAGIAVVVDADAMPEPPKNTNSGAFDPEAHPLLQAQAAAVQAAQARVRGLDRSYLPKFNYQFALYGRGSGALVDGHIDSTQGLAPEVPNWATGLTITFPALDIFSIRARKRAEAGNASVEQARYDQVVQSLKAQEARAKAASDAAAAIAENTPIQLGAAQEAHLRAQARYDAGLGTVVEVADADHLLVQAEIDDAVAHLNVWRALLATARSHGNITPFLEQVRRAGGK